MATIKAYTDIYQSKKLADILPLESADMYYEPSPGFRTEPSEVKFGDIKYAHPRSIRCWSLAALLDALSDYTLQTNTDGTVFVVCESKKPMISDAYSNPVDACVDMIIKLHEQNLL